MSVRAHTAPLHHTAPSLPLFISASIYGCVSVRAHTAPLHHTAPSLPLFISASIYGCVSVRAHTAPLHHAAILEARGDEKGIVESEANARYRARVPARKVFLGTLI